jgi:hypothetical protein
VHEKVSGSKCQVSGVGLKNWKVEGGESFNLPIIQVRGRLFPFTLNSDSVDFDVQHNETP